MFISWIYQNPQENKLSKRAVGWPQTNRLLTRIFFEEYPQALEDFFVAFLLVWKTFSLGVFQILV